jgi:hypothetical protein
MTATARVTILAVAVVVLGVIGFVILRSRVMNTDCRIVLKKVLIRWVETTGRPAQIITEKDIRSYIQQRVQETGVGSQQEIPEPNLLVPLDKVKIRQYIADIEKTFQLQLENLDSKQMIDDWFMFLRLEVMSQKLPFELSRAEEDCLAKIKFSWQTTLEMPR